MPKNIDMRTKDFTNHFSKVSKENIEYTFGMLAHIFEKKIKLIKINIAFGPITNLIAQFIIQVFHNDMKILSHLHSSQT